MRYTIWTRDYTGEWSDDGESLTEREALKAVRELQEQGIRAEMRPVTTYGGTEQRYSP